MSKEVLQLDRSQTLITELTEKLKSKTNNAWIIKEEAETDQIKRKTDPRDQEHLRVVKISYPLLSPNGDE